MHLIGASYSLFLWWRLLCLKTVSEKEEEDESAAFDTYSSYLCTLLLFVAVKNACRRLYMNIPTVTSSTSLLNRFHRISICEDNCVGVPLYMYVCTCAVK